MAASCRNLMRSTLKGHYGLDLAVSEELLVPDCRTMFCTAELYTADITLYKPLPRQSPNVMNTQKAAEPENKTNQQKKEEEEEEEEEEDNRPEYIPKRKAKNPIMKVGYAWMISLPTGVIGFILAKRQVDKNRLKQLKIRQRMKKANEGDYESERYKPDTRMQ